MANVNNERMVDINTEEIKTENPIIRMEEKLILNGENKTNISDDNNDYNDSKANPNDSKNVYANGDGKNVDVNGDGKNVDVNGDGKNVDANGDGKNVDVNGDGKNGDGKDVNVDGAENKNDRFLHVCGKYHKYSRLSFVPEERRQKLSDHNVGNVNTVPAWKRRLFKVLFWTTAFLSYSWCVWMVIVGSIIYSPDSHPCFDNNNNNNNNNSSGISNNCTASDFTMPGFNTDYLQLLAYPGVTLIAYAILLYRCFYSNEHEEDENYGMLCKYLHTLTGFIIMNYALLGFMCVTLYSTQTIGYVNKYYSGDFYGFNFYLYSYASIIIIYTLLYVVYEVGKMPTTPSAAEDREQLSMVMNNTIMGLIDVVTMLVLLTRFDIDKASSDKSYGSIYGWLVVSIVLLTFCYGFLPMALCYNQLPPRYIDRINSESRSMVRNGATYRLKLYIPILGNIICLALRLIVWSSNIFDVVMIFKNLVYVFYNLRVKCEQG